MPTKSKYRTVIIDDEFPSRMMLKSLADNHKDQIEILGEAKNGTEGAKLISKLNPDLIFLDINMPGMNGFEMLTGIQSQPFIIFTTAYEEFAVKAFETNAVDYLLKPIEEKRFSSAIQKLQRYENGYRNLDLTGIKKILEQNETRKKTTTLPIKTGDKIFLLRLENVAYLEAKDKYVFAVTGESKEHLSDLRLSELEELLPENFLRVQKSFIVNKDYITEIRKHFGNRMILMLSDKNKTRIKTGITYINQIRNSLWL